MSLLGPLIGFGLRQALGDGIENVVEAAQQRFRDHSQALPKALERAYERSWQALGIALAGDGLLEQVNVFFAGGDDKGARVQIEAFLPGNAIPFEGTPAEFRGACLAEFKRLRKGGLLSASGLATSDLARQAAGFPHYAEGAGLIEGARQAVRQVADALGEGYPNLAALLRAPTPAGPPLLASAFAYFFRREVESNEELANGLFFDGLRRLTASQAKAFSEVGKALTAVGGQLDAFLEPLGRLQLGDFAGAGESFAEVARTAPDAAAKAEAHASAYRAALERRDWPTALAELRQAADLDPGRFAPFPLHRYQPRQLLGAGGFGTAFLCHDHHSGEGVVVKALHTGSLGRGVEELFREARTLRRLKHPAIIGVRDCDFADPAARARPYLVMDHFPGATLQQFVEEHGPLGLEQLLVVAAQVAAGMKAAHAQGVLHRALKPANILVRQAGGRWDVKVTDFGLALRQQSVEASVLRSGGTPRSVLDWSAAGTPEYAPPEQLGKLPGVQPGPYSDAYAFARTCCYALFEVTELRPEQWASLPRPLADLLEGCLDPDPRQRPNGFEPVLAVLGAFLRAGEEARPRARQPRVGARRAEEEERRPLLVSAGGDGTHRTIGEAVRSASPDAVIRIRPGVYREGVVLDRPVGLLGDGPPGRVVIESADAACILMATDRALVRGLTLRCIAGQHGKKFAGVDVPQGNLLLEGCDVTSDALACVAIHGKGSTATVRDCQIHDNKEGSGVYVLEQGKGTVEGCDIFANQLAGITISRGGDPTVRDCRVHDSKEGGGVYVYDQGKGTVEGCDIFANQLAGVEIRRGGDPTVRACKIHDNKEGAGVFVWEQGKGTVEGCDIFANQFPGVEIRQGGDPTVRDCKIHHSKASCGVFVWEQGKGTVEGCDIFANQFPGVQIGQGGDPTVRACQIHDQPEHCGMHVWDQGKGTVEGCDIFANKGPGVQIRQGGDPTVRDCKIHHSKESCGVLVWDQGKGTIEGCDIFANEFPGIGIRQGGDPTVRACQIHDQPEHCGVLVGEQGKGTIEGCDIFANKLAGVAIGQGGDPAVRSCKITDNGSEAVCVRKGGCGTVESCDLRGNRRGAWDVEDGCQVRRVGNQE